MKVFSGLTLALHAGSAVAALAHNSNSTYYNPVLPGWSSDPSCIQIHGTFYCVTSTFVTFPGLPVYASKGLINWKHIGHVWNCESQLPGYSWATKEQQQGMYAATIRHRHGTFYVIYEYLGLNGKNVHLGVVLDDDGGQLSFRFNASGNGQGQTTKASAVPKGWFAAMLAADERTKVELGKASAELLSGGTGSFVGTLIGVYATCNGAGSGLDCEDGTPRAYVNRWSYTGVAQYISETETVPNIAELTSPKPKPESQPPMVCLSGVVGDKGF
ncbi:glycosyl hydrolase [Dichotomopilus funicola]|uniref:Glycosyl hydrolase n=1 Tax=Dichotomopilus funicola TaxID=1934379 RepID=A0AAN6V260_9PEZI|nr:glycosyl hydrolase [Dichotomopilus funicola]